MVTRWWTPNPNPRRPPRSSRWRSKWRRAARCSSTPETRRSRSRRARLAPDDDKQEQEGTTRRRGTRGGRARANRDSDSVLDDPRVAGRRPAAQPAEDAPAEEPAKPATRRRAASTRRSTAKAESAEPEPEAKPATRRRRSTAKADDPEPEQAEAKPATRRRRSTAKAADPEPEQAEAKPATRRRRSAATAETPEPEQAEAKPATRRRRSAATAEAASADGSALAEQVRSLQAVLEQQTKTLDALREQQERAARKLRLGVFVDVPNLIYGAERGEGGPTGAVVHMGKLLDYLRDGRELIRATAYAPVSDDPGEPVEQQRFVAPFVPHDYRIVTKPLKRFADGSIKGNFDVEMALDMVTMAERLDVVSLVSGDADFSRAVELLQERGVRVEVVAFSGSTSIEMRALADHYIDVGTLMDRVGV
ncbi:MAG: NYN domain-containing protein [Chloroflexi bacterium]|nr:NYN domain-containing protein [Chloroflexota bacterium]